VIELGKVRSDLTLVVALLSKVDMLEVGFLGTIVSRKLLKVKERPAAAPSAWLSREEDAAVGCHQTRCKDSEIPYLVRQLSDC